MFPLRRGFKSAFVYLVISVVTLSVCELAYRKWSGVPLIPNENLVSRAVDRHVNPVGASVIDPDLGWVMRPFFESPAKAKHPLTTGAFGLRMNVPGEVRESPQGAILAVGDSFTAGSEEGDDGSWPAILERKIGTPVLNGGVGGYGVDQIVLRGEKLAAKLAPMVVIYSFLDEDILRNAYDIYGGYKPYFRLAGENGLNIEGVPVDKVPPKVDRLGVVRTGFGYSLIAHSVMMALAPKWWLGRDLQFRRVYSNDEAVKVSCRLVDRIRADSERWGFEPYILIQYGGDLVLAGKRSRHAEGFLKCLGTKGIKFLDTFGPLHLVAEKNLKRFRGLYNERPAETRGARFGHMSEIGNAFIADLIRDNFFYEPSY